MWRELLHSGSRLLHVLHWRWRLHRLHHHLRLLRSCAIPMRVHLLHLLHLLLELPLVLLLPPQRLLRHHLLVVHGGRRRRGRRPVCHLVPNRHPNSEAHYDHPDQARGTPAAVAKQKQRRGEPAGRTVRLMCVENWVRTHCCLFFFMP